MDTQWVQGHEAKSLTRQQRWDLLSPYLLRHGGGCMAYSTLQEGMEYMIVPGRGYMAYTRVGFVCPSVFVLADPICPRGDLRAILDAFLKQFPRAVFVQATESVADTLQEFGLLINDYGIETEIDLAAFDLKGKDKQDLRTARNKVIRLGIRIEEIGAAGIAMSQLRELSRGWLATRTDAGIEQRFLNRPLVWEAEPFVRTFCASLDGRVMAFVVFDPMFEGGRVAGYMADILRASPAAHPRILQAIQLAAMDDFRREGVMRYSLGCSPLCSIHDGGFRNSPFTTLLFVGLYQCGNWVYHWKGLARNKRQFAGTEHRVYVAMRATYSLVQLYRGLAACNIRPVRQFLWSLWCRFRGAMGKPSPEGLRPGSIPHSQDGGAS